MGAGCEDPMKRTCGSGAPWTGAGAVQGIEATILSPCGSLAAAWSPFGMGKRVAGSVYPHERRPLPALLLSFR
jgi:hypothetical protein